jgi:hypothetical protein
VEELWGKYSKKLNDIDENIDDELKTLKKISNQGVLVKLILLSARNTD